MSAVYRKELKGYFTGITGYLFTAVLLIAAGIYTMVYNLSYQYTVFQYVYASITFLYLILIPILTMRSFPEERKQRTDQLLYSLPIKMTEIVAGKYFAAITVLAIPVIVMTAYPFILSSFGEFNFKIILSTMLCFYLLGCVLVAVCMFVSTLTENQIVSAILSFIVVFIPYFSKNIVNYASSSIVIALILLLICCALITLVTALLTRNKVLTEAIGTVLLTAVVVILVFNSTLLESAASGIFDKIAVFENIYEVIYGSFDLTYPVFLISIAFLFNFFSVQVLEKRRWA